MTMASHRKCRPVLFYGFLVLVLFTAITDGLECYFCAGTGGKMPCLDHTTYKNAAKCKTERYRKNCTAPNDAMCTIETHYSMGAPFVQIRDCNDGNTFYLKSTNSSTTDYKRLKTLGVNNETACAWNGQYLVCLSKCNTTYCNGPQLDMQTCAGFSVHLTSLVMFIVFAVFMRIAI